jgi:hypothetical protein
MTDLKELKIPAAMRPAAETIPYIPALGRDGTAVLLGQTDLHDA